MGLPPLEPESNASANSAISAYLVVLPCGASVSVIYYSEVVGKCQELFAKKFFFFAKS